jgi:hypothetical protein
MGRTHPTLRHLIPGLAKATSHAIAMVIAVSTILSGFALVAREHKRGQNPLTAKKSAHQKLGLALMVCGAIVHLCGVTIALVAALLAYLAWG